MTGCPLWSKWSGLSLSRYNRGGVHAWIKRKAKTFYFWLHFTNLLKFANQTLWELLDTYLFKNPIYTTIRIFKNSFLIWKTWVVILESELVTSGYNDSPDDSSMSNPNQYFSNICIRITWRISLKCRSIQQVLTEAWDSVLFSSFQVMLTSPVQGDPHWIKPIHCRTAGSRTKGVASCANMSWWQPGWSWRNSWHG